MLHTSTVEPRTFSVLKKLMAIDELQQFYLVGGTCLSLRYGHRKSIDIDLFSTNNFENETVLKILGDNFSGFKLRTSSNVGIFGFIDDVKIDLVKHHFFRQIDNAIVEETIRMFSDKDLMAIDRKSVV